MTCNHQWSAETHEGVPSQFCHNCNEWEIEVKVESLRAEVERLRASRLPDVEYARLDVMWQELVRERDAAKAAVIDAALIHAKLIEERDGALSKADAYKRNWYEAKSEFGTVTAKLRERLRSAERKRDEARDALGAAPCGECAACLKRAEGFASAGMVDSWE